MERIPAVFFTAYCSVLFPINEPQMCLLYVCVINKEKHHGAPGTSHSIDENIPWPIQSSIPLNPQIPSLLQPHSSCPPS